MSLGWIAFGMFMVLLALIALLPPFDSTDDKNWGDKTSEPDNED